MRAYTEDDLRSAAPAVFAEAPATNVSGKYQFVSTIDLVREFWDRDYVVVDAAQASVRKNSSRDSLHALHMLRLQPANAPQELDGLFQQILLSNSHRGHNALNFGVGIYRLVCTNGMVVGKAESHYRARHTGNVHQTIDEALPHIFRSQERALERVERWADIELTPARIERFADEAAALRSGRSPHGYDLADVLRVRRAEDEGNSLWRVFNRVQENLTQGGVQTTTANGQTRTTRPLRGIGLNMRFNADLWDLADAVVA